MDLRFRRALYLTFFVIFAVAATGLLFYLQGYRYNPQKKKIERTGAVMVDSLPVGATIVLNGGIQPKATPVTIQPLKPGDYEVIINLAGRQTWRKVLPVKPSRVTFTGQVRLWPNPATGDRLAGTALTEATLAPNGENLLYRSSSGLSTGLWLYNLATGKTTLLTRSATTTIATLEWSPSSREFLVGETNSAGSLNYRLFSLDNSDWEDVRLPASTTPRLVHWGEDESSLYLSTDSEIYQWKRRTGVIKLLWREQLESFRLHDGLIFGLARGTAGGLSIKMLNLSNLKTLNFDEPLPLSTNAAFLEARGEWLPLFDQDRHLLYLIHSPLTELKPVRRLPEVTNLDWSADGERLLLINNFEIWEYRLQDDLLNLLLRVSTPLIRGRFYMLEPYLIYASGHEVWALELDARGEQQRWLLAKYDNEVEDLFLDLNGKTLTVKTSNGFYRLTLTAQPGSRLGVPLID